MRNSTVYDGLAVHDRDPAQPAGHCRNGRVQADFRVSPVIVG